MQKVYDIEAVTNIFLHRIDLVDYGLLGNKENVHEHILSTFFVSLKEIHKGTAGQPFT